MESQPDRPFPLPPRHPPKAPALYAISRVEACEGDPAWRYQGCLRRILDRLQTRAHLDPETQTCSNILRRCLEQLLAQHNAVLRDEALRLLERTHFSIPRLSIPELEREALDDYRTQAPSHGRRWRPPMPVLHRLVVNHLRHNRTDWLAQCWQNRFGQPEVYGMARIRLLMQMARVYPELENECQRQAGCRWLDGSRIPSLPAPFLDRLMT